MEVSGCFNLRAYIRDVLVESIYPLDSRILLDPLNEEEQKSWVMFKVLARYHTQLSHIGLGDASIELNHPFVPVVSDFAVAAFNELCRMYCKKGVEKNIYESEVVNVKYNLDSHRYIFFITLEAMEEDVASVYEATVDCHCYDGRRTLIKFIRSSRPPTGRKFKGMTDLICEKSMSETVKEQKKAMKAELKLRCNDGKGKKRSRESSGFLRLKKDYEAVKAACRIFDQHAHLVPIDWKIKRSNPDDWFVPNKVTGLQPRSNEHSCGGYDYHNPLTGLKPYLNTEYMVPAIS